MGLFRLTKTNTKGQVSSLYVNANNINTERGLMQHKREEVMRIMDFQKGDSIVAEVVKATQI